MNDSFSLKNSLQLQSFLYLFIQCPKILKEKNGIRNQILKLYHAVHILLSLILYTFYLKTSLRRKKQQKKPSLSMLGDRSFTHRSFFKEKLAFFFAPLLKRQQCSLLKNISSFDLDNILLSFSDGIHQSVFTVFISNYRFISN